LHTGASLLLKKQIKVNVKRISSILASLKEKQYLISDDQPNRQNMGVSKEYEKRKELKKAFLFYNVRSTTHTS
jgi:hypothetical protein